MRPLTYFFFCYWSHPLKIVQNLIQNHQKMTMGVSRKEKGGFLPRNYPFPYEKLSACCFGLPLRLARLPTLIGKASRFLRLI